MMNIYGQRRPIFYKNITDIYHAQYQHESNSKDIHRQLLLNYALYFWNYIQGSSIAFYVSYKHSRTMYGVDAG